MKDLISREALREDFYELEIHGTMAVKAVLPIIEERIDNLPAVDAVEVVRCGECEFIDDKCAHGIVCICDHGGMCGTFVADTDFCSCGKRRMDGE